jgi:hypothetical protein
VRYNNQVTKTQQKYLKLWLGNLFTFVIRLWISYGFVILILILPPVLQAVSAFAHILTPSSVSAEVRRQAVDQAFRLVIGDQQPQTVFTELEASHLQDVHGIYEAFITVGFYLALCVLATKLFLKKTLPYQYSREQIQLMRWGSRAIIICTLFGLLIFPFFFELFHRLFFPQGNYSFPDNSLLIQSFPISFWGLNFFFLQAGVFTLLQWQLHRAEKRNL